MRVWVTRTRPGAERTAGRLRALGHHPLVRPALATAALPATVDAAGAAALAFTSANGVSAFAKAHPARDLPVFAVGEATAAAARRAGFAHVRSAAGDVESLAALIAGARPGGPVLHAAGRPRAGDLAGRLGREGVPVRTVELYETRPVADLRPPEDAEAALVHSPHAARVLAGAGLDRRLPLFCLSEAVAEPLRATGFEMVAAAQRPDEAALLALLPARLGAGPDRR